MCGIAALINTKPTDGALIQRMTDIVSYRGPDGDGHNGFDGNRVWLGQRRLAIIDLSNAGREPMSYKNERYWITYNGEVYNYIELRRELEAVGYVFASKTDTEVVLAAYDYWGTECLHRFNGMWAFVLYDTL
ncbi:MAG TPA: asparagine synthetase B, partial [bacterium]|nr:asparagine synthetase B [bacterium]